MNETKVQEAQRRHAHVQNIKLSYNSKTIKKKPSNQTRTNTFNYIKIIIIIKKHTCIILNVFFFLLPLPQSHVGASFPRRRDREMARSQTPSCFLYKCTRCNSDYGRGGAHCTTCRKRRRLTLNQQTAAVSWLGDHVTWAFWPDLQFVKNK